MHALTLPLVLQTLLGAAPGTLPGTTPDAALARRLWLAAQDQQAELDHDSARTLLRAARRADPSFFSAHHLYVKLMRSRGSVAELRREYAAEPGSPVVDCVRATIEAPGGSGAELVEDLLEIERRDGPNPCTAIHLATHLHDLAPPAERLAQALQNAERATRVASDESDSWVLYASALAALGRGEEALAALEEAIRRAPHAVARVDLWLRHEQTLLTLRDTAAAIGVERRLRAAIARDGRPGLRFRLLPPQRPHRSAAEQREWLGNAARFVRSYRAPDLELGYLLYGGSLGLDAGDATGALSDLDRAVALADSLDSPHWRLVALRLRGRAYVRLGDLAAAERDLRLAVEAGGDDPQELAEAYHNLAHAYESAGRMEEAARAADRFVELAGRFRYRQPRMMSLRDAGIIRWGAGWHAAAEAAFAEMVEVVDEQDANHFWAGEYFERTGDLRRALHYYGRGVEVGGSELSLNLGGMARVLDALGLADSAAVVARAHDRSISNQLDVPLLPLVLARAGRVEAAVRVSEEWMERRRREGNLQSAALAGEQLAELLLDAGRRTEALEVAVHTSELASRINLTEQQVGALRLKGLALLALGRRGSALASLEEAASLARARPSRDGVLATQLALGEALAEAGQREEALAAFDLAARAVEGVTGRLDLDVDRARYRARNLAPFDGALGLLLARPSDPGSLDGLISWSQRRKAAALAGASGLGAAEAGMAPATLGRRSLMARLGQGEALVDYLAVEGRLAALVLTRERAELVPLPISTDSVGKLADALRRPFTSVHQGRLDLARAPYDVAVAHALHRALVHPLADRIAGVRRLLLVPDGPLHYVPFDALVSHLPGGGLGATGYRGIRYAVDDHEITYLASTRFLAAGGARATTGRAEGASSVGRVLAITRGAPGGASETEAIERVWPDGAVTVLREGEATEPKVWEQARGHAILHFATHAVADDRDPLASHLRLASDADSDGWLHLAEIAGAPWPARLVVLSACETLRGPLYAGEGMMGLARAFLAGGAGGVVATAWPIGPETARLMEEFYRALAAGADPTSALRKAKLVLRSDPRTAHPFFWAGVTLIEGTRARP